MGRFMSSYEICECCVIAASRSVYQIAQRQPHFPPFVPNSFALCSGATSFIMQRSLPQQKRPPKTVTFSFAI